MYHMALTLTEKDVKKSQENNPRVEMLCARYTQISPLKKPGDPASCTVS